jgi:Choline/Carnitine o-acyltransferase.
VDYAGKSPLNMRQYGKLLSYSRVPYAKKDGEIATRPKDSGHVIVAHNNHVCNL